jgi:hypothetical protein
LKIHQKVDFQHLRIDFRDSKTWKNEVRESSDQKNAETTPDFGSNFFMFFSLAVSIFSSRV